MFFSKPLYIFSFFTGLCVFNSKGKFSIWATLWAVAFLGAASVIGMHYRISLARIHSYDFQVDPFSHALPTLSLFGKVLSCSVHLIMSIVKRREFENVFDVLKLQKSPAGHFVVVYAGVSMSVIILALLLKRIFNWPPYMDEVRVLHVVDSASLVYFNTLCYYINLQFCCLVDNGRVKIAHLIKRLSKGDFFCETQHLKITETLKKTNQLYGTQTAVNCAQAFSYLLTHICYLYIYKKVDSLPEPEYERALQVHALFSFIMFYELGYFCEMAASEVDEFNSELSKLLLNTDLRRNARLKLYAMVAPSVDFTACELFHLGYPLVTSVITATVTYVVVLIQFV